MRQFAGSFGVALTIALLGTASDTEALLVGFDRIWILLIVGGALTSFSALPLTNPMGRGSQGASPSS